MKRGVRHVTSSHAPYLLQSGHVVWRDAIHGQLAAPWLRDGEIVNKVLQEVLELPLRVLHHHVCTPHHQVGLRGSLF